MKLVQAVIDPERLAAVQEALSAVEVFRLTVGDVSWIDAPDEGRGLKFDAQPGVRLDVAVNENFVRPTIEAIYSGARGGLSGESDTGVCGRIYVLPLKDVIRIRTGERGSDAI